MEDHTLIKKAQQGDADAFGALYERHAAGVFRFLYAHLAERMDAEDLTGEVFLRAWRTLPQYHERGFPFTAYLLRIARNALTDFYRHSAHPAHPQTVEQDLDELPELQRDDLEDDLHAHLGGGELAQVLGKLTEDYRMVLVLRFLNDLSPVETAHVMHRSAGAVRVLQHRALLALRALLEQQKEGLDG